MVRRRGIAAHLMADRIQDPRTREPEHQTDAFMPNAIRYLDSPTDYREYLPQAGRSLRLQESEFITLDDLPDYVRARLRNFTLIAILFCVILLLLLRIG